MQLVIFFKCFFETMVYTNSKIATSFRQCYFNSQLFGVFLTANVCLCVFRYMCIFSLDWIFGKPAFLWQPGHTRRHLDKEGRVLEVQSA